MTKDTWRYGSRRTILFIRFHKSGAGRPSLPMRTALGIHALVWQAQPLHRPPANQMLLDNCNRIFRLYAAVPDCLWINHYRGTMLALIQATGLVDSYPGP
jgi:hypothetical protein